MRKISQKQFKGICIISCVLSGISLLYGLALLPDSILFIINNIISLALFLYIVRFRIADEETESLKEKLQAEIEKQNAEYEKHQEKMRKEYGEHQEKMKLEHESYEKSKSEDYDSFIKTRDEKIAELENVTSSEIVKNKKHIVNLKKYILTLESKKDDIIREINSIENDKKTIKADFEKELAFQNEELVKIKNEISEVLAQIVVKQYDYSEYDGITSEECKNKLAVIRVKEKDLCSDITKKIPDDKWLTSTEKYRKANAFKELVRCYNAECNNIIASLTSQNIDTQREKIARVHKSLNKLNEYNEIEMPTEFLEMKLEELNICYTYELKKQQEAEEQREIKLQMLEEEKVRREIEREKLRIEKEETQFKNEINKLMSYMSKSTNDTEKEFYMTKINELEEKLAQLEKDKANVFEREQNTRAGFVYIISNIGSFGDDVYKIGMTRRLIPMDRIKELSSASVPFPFDVHAMIFSEDAPALETLLHNRFRKNQVNMVNDKKEFFRVDLNEIKNVVLTEHNETVKFTMIADADEYRRTLAIQSSANKKTAPLL